MKKMTRTAVAGAAALAAFSADAATIEWAVSGTSGFAALLQWEPVEVMGLTDNHSVELLANGVEALPLSSGLFVPDGAYHTDSLSMSVSGSDFTHHIEHWPMWLHQWNESDVTIHNAQYYEDWCMMVFYFPPGVDTGDNVEGFPELEWLDFAIYGASRVYGPWDGYGDGETIRIEFDMAQGDLRWGGNIWLGDVSPVPEPATASLLALGFAALALRRRKR
ncbi:MAG: PEP-CTERM sorting domain-containing protein [Kiritimatiellaeota bacterium]|nr:PEP-CTERM sorting domain-containing protein [Kiritimatiellota bacterium]